MTTQNAALSGTHLECAVVFLQLPAQTLQLAASQDGLAVLVPQRVLLLHHLVLLLLQRPHLLLGVAVHLQLSPASTRQVCQQRSKLTGELYAKIIIRT